MEAARVGQEKELKWMAVNANNEQSKIITETMLECYNNTEEIALAIAKDNEGRDPADKQDVDKETE
jgi:hypothetical protein